MNVFYSSKTEISVSVQCLGEVDVKIECVERKFSRDLAKMKEISLGKVIIFHISMDKIQLSKRNQNSAKVISFGSPDSNVSAPMTPSFGAFTFSPRVLSDTPTLSPMLRPHNSNDSRLSYFYMKNPKLPGMPETQWSLRYRLDCKK